MSYVVSLKQYSPKEVVCQRFNDYNTALIAAEMIIQTLSLSWTKTHWTTEGFVNNHNFVGGHHMFDQGCVILMSETQFKEIQ